MKKASLAKPSDDLRAEYDLSRLKGGVRGKYYSRATAGIDVVSEGAAVNGRAPVASLTRQRTTRRPTSRKDT